MVPPASLDPVHVKLPDVALVAVATTFVGVDGVGIANVYVCSSNT